jgi:gas vesicle protein
MDLSRIFQRGLMDVAGNVSAISTNAAVKSPGFIRNMINSPLADDAAALLLREPTANHGTRALRRDIGASYDTARAHLRDVKSQAVTRNDELARNLSQIKDPASPAANEIRNAMSYNRQTAAHATLAQYSSHGREAWDMTKRMGQWAFTEGSARDRLIKGGAVVGGYMGANMIGRATTGGGLTYNNRGERDIAGIPFI